MQMLLEFLPLAAFLIAYHFFGGIYPATATLMVAMVLVLAVMWLRTRRPPVMFSISTVLVLLFGTATLLLRSARFIQWKPTIFLWLLALAFLVSAFVGRKPLVQRLLQPALGDAELPRGTWLRLNAAWVLYGLIIGAVNLALAYGVSESTWVDVKVPLLVGSMFLFLAGQMFWLHRRGHIKA